MASNTYLATVSFWRAAHTARDPNPVIAMAGEATLWNLVTSEYCPDKVRDAAKRVLNIKGEQS